MSAPAGDSGTLRSGVVMAAGTIVSRITGFVRLALVAAALGTALRADVFNVANTIPNSLYILLAGGVFNAVLVPQLVREMRLGADRGDAYANRVLTVSALTLAVITAGLVAAAPFIVALYADPAFFTPALAPQREAMIAFTRLCLPQVFFYGMYVLLGQVLNARDRFGPMMWAPVANNLVAIAIFGLYLVGYGARPDSAGYTTGEQLLLGLGSTLGIAVQTAILVPYLRAAGFRFRPRLDLRGAGLGHTARLGGWTVAFVIANQVAYAVVVRLATGGAAAGGAGFSAYAYAFALLMLPHAVVTVSLATATLPRLSRLSAAGDAAALREEFVALLRMCLAVLVPAAVGFVALAGPVTGFVVGWGAAAGDTTPVAVTLTCFTPGLVAFTVHYLTLRGFYAQEDTRTPFLLQCVIATTNIALAVTAVALAPGDMAAPALALAYSGAYLVGAAVSLPVLARRLGGLAPAGLAAFGGRLILAALPAAAVAWAVTVGLGADSPGGGKLATGVALLVAVAAAVVVYIGLARLLNVGEVRAVTAVVAARLVPARRR